MRVLTHMDHAEMVDSHCQPAEMTRSSLVKIRILVVDDDSTALLVVMEVLRKWNYEVTGVKHPMEAISTLRMSRGLFDLIVTDYHMPVMNGIELQQRVHEEFGLPVIMMSGDDNEYVMLRSLECGAAFFILKPVKPMDCKNIWQYAVARSNKGKAIVVPSKSMGLPAATMPAENLSHLQAPLNVNPSENGMKTKPPHKNKEKGQAGIKKPKVAWTNFLHNRFLQAVNFIGIEKAVPKKILELMNVPGLTRQNVASHLQKYRIFLRRVADKGREQSIRSSSNVLVPDLRIFYTPSHSPSIVNSATRGEFPHFPLSKVRTPLLQQGLPSSSTAVFNNNCNMLDANRFPSQEAANSSSQARFGQQNFGTASDALRRSGIPPFRMDLLNNTIPDLSKHSAANDITALVAPKQGFQNQSIQTSSSLLITPSPQDPNSWKLEFGFGNYSGGHRSTVFPVNAYPSSLRSGDPHISRGLGVNTNQEQLIGANQQLPGGISSRGLMGPMCNIQKEQGENGQPGQVNPTINTSNLSNNCYNPQLTDGDLPDVLDQLPNLSYSQTQGQEEMLLTAAFTNDSCVRKDHRVAEENTLWDYEELMGPAMSSNQPAAAEPGRIHQKEQIVPGNDVPHDFDWDDDFIERLLLSAAPSPIMD